MSLTVPMAWLEGHAGKQALGVAGSIPGGGIPYDFEFFDYFPLITARRRPKKTEMKSSMAFIQSNECTEKDLILKQIWRRFI